MEQDPVCGMEVSDEDAVASSEFDGETYYFCSQSCKRQFDQDPQQYIDRLSEEAA